MSDTAGPAAAAPRATPWVELRSAAFHTFIYQKMMQVASPDAQPGDCVTVYDKHGQLFGHGLYNPRSALTLRMLNFSPQPIDAAFWRETLARAVDLRTRLLGLPAVTDAYRLVHAEGDDLSGLVVDRFADVLSLEVFSLGMWRRLDELLPVLHELVGTQHHRVHVDDRVQEQEAFRTPGSQSPQLPATVNITEHGVRFRVQFDVGHKTGFFCDQRDNRRRFAGMVNDAEVLDLCSYSGGFGLYAKVLGKARAATCVDLDEEAVELARRNANLNQVRVDTVQADAFIYMRQMQMNRRQFDAVVLDPPKLIFGRNDTGGGDRKYADLNRLAAGLVRPGGLLLTCSCSGALAREEFTRLVLAALRQADREAQLLDSAGAAADHPVSPRCPESAYLKALWLRLR
ncbi:MAG TPA: class I SAM-dependent rRNA methyltransferase [Phycisphaerae bacterium]|nr:class I SAM-dependent rRNA methyltransferase [Phycisphaerae bacterium]HNU45777.1 class I SAM-dependent rRNA methyltransferase [Phycisphaerae bacterium]